MTTPRFVNMPLRCGSCGHRWVWRVAMGMEFGAFLTRARAEQTCPGCGVNGIGYQGVFFDGPSTNRTPDPTITGASSPDPGGDASTITNPAPVPDPPGDGGTADCRDGDLSD